MLITQTITWAPVSWPTTQAATQYALFLNTASTPYSTVTNTTSATVTFDDTQSTVITIRPTDGTTYGPAQSLTLGNGMAATRGWIRSFVRKALSDRVDTTGATGKFADDTLNDYIAQAVRDYSLRFGLEKDTMILLTQGVLTYALPPDVRDVTRVSYRAVNPTITIELTYAPFKGGEMPVDTVLGYPRLGVLLIPMQGRWYSGTYSLYENKITIDFQPLGGGDLLYLEYKARIPTPTDDATPLPIPLEDLELLTLATEAYAWEELEGKDVNLSRWRTKDDGGRRDDLPTEKMSARIWARYQKKLDERRNLRPRVKRLVRR